MAIPGNSSKQYLQKTAWALFALAVGEAILAFLLKRIHPDPTGAAFIINAYSWLLFSPLIYYVIQHDPKACKSKLHFVSIHLLVCVLFFMLKAINNLIAFDYMEYHIMPFAPFWERFYSFLFRPGFPSNLFVYLGLMGVYFSFQYYQKFKERELMAAQLEAQLAKTQLQMISMQLNPHFLFNALNGISTLVHRDPDTADRMIARLSDLLRTTLSNKGKSFVSLSDELETINRYLDLEKMRFGERLSVEIEIDPAVKDAKVPCMLLQPLVENAIKHGISQISRPGMIRLQSTRKNGKLLITIDDNGPGFNASAHTGKNTGMGLSNCRERMELLFGRDFRFELSQSPLPGARVVISIPFQPIEEKAGSESC